MIPFNKKNLGGVSNKYINSLIDAKLQPIQQQITELNTNVNNLNTNVNNIGVYGSNIGYYEISGTKQSNNDWENVLLSGDIEEGNSVMTLAFNFNTGTISGNFTVGIMAMDITGYILARETRYIEDTKTIGFNNRISLTWLFHSTSSMNKFVLRAFNFNSNGYEVGYDGLLQILYLHS